MTTLVLAYNVHAAHAVADRLGLDDWAWPAPRETYGRRFEHVVFVEGWQHSGIRVTDLRMLLTQDFETTYCHMTDDEPKGAWEILDRQKAARDLRLATSRMAASVTAPFVEPLREVERALVVRPRWWQRWLS